MAKMALMERLNLSVADYLQGELLSDTKYEYINGEVYAISGAKRAHIIISMNLSGLFLPIFVTRPAACSIRT
jgi:hypothetical protein